MSLSVPPLRSRRLPAVAGFALIAGVATLAAAAMLLIEAQAVKIDRASRAIAVAVSDGDPGTQVRRAGEVLKMLEQRGDLLDISVERQAATARALAPWLTAGETAPAMIDATLAPNADEAGVRRALAGQPGIAIVREGANFDSLLRLMIELRTIALTILIVALAAAVPVGVTATLARIGEQRGTVTTLLRLGANPGQIAALLRPPVRSEALFGGVGGVAIGVIAMLFIAAQLGNADDGAVTAVRIAPSDWLILAAIPPVLIVIGLLGAEAAARLAIRRQR